MYTKPRKTQIYADLTQINADKVSKSARIRVSACRQTGNLRPSALKNIFFKKKLGQNFLVDKNIQRKIIDACELKASDIVLEIGSGRGELTGLIAKKVNKVYAIELDYCLCQILKEKFIDYPNIRVINRDILRFNLKRYFGKVNKVKVIGNIPYYITTPIIEHLFKFKNKIESIFITIQKEFAQRLTACAGSRDYGSFSCFVQYYTQAKIIFTIKKTCFLPKPKVDSCFINLKIKEQLPIKIKSERLLFKIIRLAFNQRRKTLRNSLKSIVSSQKLELFFKRYNINPNIRPEDLTLFDFANLANTLKKS